MSVAELCRRLGSAPATADSVSTGATPVLVGDLLRREGCPPVRAEVPAARVAPSPEPEPDEDQPVVPTPRSRGDACKTALGAGGLVVAGSVLGAALLAAAGVGGPLPFGQGGDDAAGQFQGEGTLVKPGTAYGSVRGRDVVARSGLFRAIAYYTPFGPSTGAATGAGAHVAASVPGTRLAGPVQGIPPAGVAMAVSPAGGIVTPVVNGMTQTAVGSLGQAANPIVATVVTPAAPLVNGVTTAVTPVADLVGTVIAPALEPMTPVVEAATPLVNAAVPAVGPVVAATESVIQPVLTVTGPAVAPALGAVGSVLDLAAPLLPSLPTLPGELTDPVVSGDLPASPGSFGQATTGNAVSAVGDAAAGTTSAVQGATDTADEVLPVAPVATASRVVARAQTSLVDPPTLRLPIVAPQATSSAEQAAADATGVLTKVVPVQATGSPERAATDAPSLPTRVLPAPDVDTQAAETIETLTTPRTTAQAEPPTEPLRIVAPLDDPEPSAEPRTTPLRIVGPETSEDTRAESTPDAPAPRRIPAADTLTDKAGALLGR